MFEVGLVGLGNIGSSTSPMMEKYAPNHLLPASHAEAIKGHGSFILKGVCDIDEKKIRDYRFANKNVESFLDYQDMLKQNYSTISIATRTRGRTLLIEQAIESGVDSIHFEKPLCNSYSELEAFRELTRDNKKLLTYGCWRRYLGRYKFIRDYLRSGALGKHIQTSISFGNSLLMWTHTHSIDLINFFAEPAHPISVSADLRNLQYALDNKDCVITDPYVREMTIDYSDGHLGSITQGSGMQVTLYCEFGTVLIRNDAEVVTIYSKKDDDPYYRLEEDLNFPAQKYKGLTEVFELHRLGLEGSKLAMHESSMAIKSSIHSMGVIFAALESSVRKKERVELGDHSKDLIILAKHGDRYA